MSEATIQIKVEAWNFGSPADVYVEVYNPDQVLKKSRDYGDYSYDLDPAFQYTTTTPGNWYLRVKESHDAGGPLYWYVMQYDLETI